jgi:hypothetical protein
MNGKFEEVNQVADKKIAPKAAAAKKSAKKPAKKLAVPASRVTKRHIHPR